MEVWKEEVAVPPPKTRKELTGLDFVLREVKGICEDLIIFESKKTPSREQADIWGHLPATPGLDSREIEFSNDELHVRIRSGLGASDK